MASKGRILLVTSGSGRATAIGDRLRGLGYEVVAAVSVSEVADFVRHHYADVVVSTASALGDGASVGAETHAQSIGRVRADVGAQRLPIVAIGAPADASARAAAIAAGADDYVLESTDDVDLGLRLRSQVRLRQMDLELRSRVALLGGAAALVAGSLLGALARFRRPELPVARHRS